MSTNQEISTRSYAPEDLRNVNTMKDFAALANAHGVVVENAADVLGDGFELLSTKDKARLVDVPFVIVDYRFTDGDNGEFVTARLITDRDEKFIINDGSTGIRDQLKGLQTVGVQAIYIPKGLRVSEYDYEDEKGEKSKAKTYYLSSSK